MCAKDRRNVLQNMSPESKAQYGAMKSHKQKMEFRDKYAQSRAFSWVGATKSKEESEVIIDRSAGDRVPMSQVYIHEGVTGYPDLQNANPEDIQAHLDLL